MTLFKKDILLENEREAIVLSCIGGEIVPLEKVPNAAISTSIFGEGFGIVTEGGTLVCPVDGKVRDVSDRGRTITFKGEDGLKLFVNVDDGSDEIEPGVVTGEVLKVGDEMCTIGKGVVSVVITNAERLSKFEVCYGNVKAGADAMYYRLRPKAPKP